MRPNLESLRPARLDELGNGFVSDVTRVTLEDTDHVAKLLDATHSRDSLPSHPRFIQHQDESGVRPRALLMAIEMYRDIRKN